MSTTNRKPQVEGVAAFLLCLTWATAALRFYVRGFMVRSFWLEDWLALAALLLFTATAVLALLGISHSMGQHLVDVPLVDLAPAMMYWFSVELAYVSTTCILKLSIAAFLLRIATRRSHRAILYTLMTVVIVLTIGYFFFLVFQCSPVNYFWLQFSGEVGSCLAPTIVGDMTYIHSAINASADVVLALLPVVIIIQLDLNPRTKVSLSCIMSLGIVACAAVVTRIPYVKILVDNAKDFLYSSTDVVIWSAIEPGLGITAANLATLRPLFQRFLSRKKLWGDTTPQYGYHSRIKSGYSGKGGYLRSTSQGGQEELGMQKGLRMDEFGKMELSRSNGTVTTVEVGPPSIIVRREEVGLAISSSEERLNAEASTPSWYYEPRNQRIMGDGSTTPWPTAIQKTIRTEVVSSSNIIAEPRPVRTKGSPQMNDNGNAQTFPEKDSFEEEMQRRGRSNTGMSTHSRRKGLSPPHFYTK